MLAIHRFGDVIELVITLVDRVIGWVPDVAPFTWSLKWRIDLRENRDQHYSMLAPVPFTVSEENRRSGGNPCTGLGVYTDNPVTMAGTTNPNYRVALAFLPPREATRSLRPATGPVA